MPLIVSALARSRWTRLSLLAALVASAPALAQLTPADAAAQMGRGINIGNTMEPPQEGAWNNAPVQEHYFDDYVAAGFSTVRVPVRWDQHMGRTAPFAVDEAWMDRVEQVVDWGLERGLFVILNSHHDDWLKQDYDNPTLQARFDSLWSQIATRFQGKSDKLLFEMFNEPFDPMTLAQTNDMNARVLPLIRRTNPTRLVLYSGASYSSRPQLIAADIPDDDYVMGYYHSYDPYTFGILGQGTWGTSADRTQLRQSFDQIAAWSASNDVPVVLSEFGAPRNADYNSRMRFYGAFIQGAMRVGIPFQAWDDGGDFGIYQRSGRDWNDVKDILIYTAAGGPNQFAASLRDDSLAVLSWDAPSGSTGLVVQRRRSGTFEALAEIDAGRTTYVDTLRAGPGDYTYRVISRSEVGPDAYSYPQRVTVAPFARSPFGGEPVQLPGTIEAEAYDVGGEGLTYHDTDEDNVPGAFRPYDAVDIEARADGGYQVAYIDADEWIEYTVLVPTTGRYTVTAYVASQDGGGEFSFAAGASYSGTFRAPQTGDWETLAPVSGTMRLSEGEQVLRFRVASGEVAPFNLDRIVVETTGTTAGEDEPTPEVGVRVFPNPARGRVAVMGTGAASGGRIEVYDVVGRRVVDVALTGDETEVRLDGLSGGTYVLRVVQGGETVAQAPLVIVR